MQFYILLVPPFPQPLSLYHRFCNNDSYRQSTNSQHQLDFVKVLTEYVESPRWRGSGEEEVKTVCEDEGSGL